MPCRHCASSDHDHVQVQEECQAILRAAADQLLARDLPGQLDLQGLPASEPVLGPEDPVNTQIKLRPYSLKAVGWGESFVLVEDLKRNPLDPPVYIKGIGSSSAIECFNLREGTRRRMSSTMKVARIRINSVVFEYIDVEEITGVAKVVHAGNDMPAEAPTPGRYAGEPS